MISYQEALLAIGERALPLAAETVALDAAHNRVLAEAVLADCDWPRFDNSAVDGFGVRVSVVSGASTQSPVRLRLAGTVQAGAEPGSAELPPGSAWRILTGAAIPRSVEAVVMKEDTEVSGDTVSVTRPAAPGDHIRRRGEEFTPGATLLERGARVTPAVMGLLASLGHTTCTVHRRAAAALICTGDELVPPGAVLRPGQIYDSNAPALAAALWAAGAEPTVTSRVPDQPKALEGAVREGLARADVVITVGGVSVGEYDFVREVMARLGVQTVFWRVAIKPGKPNYFGVYERAGRHGAPAALVFGLPGNPVSALCSYHQFVLPALRQMMGLCETDPLSSLSAVLDAPLRQRPGRLDFVRGRLRRAADGWHVTPVQSQGSQMIAGLAAANCLIHMPADRERIDAGQAVQVQPLAW